MSDQQHRIVIADLRGGRNGTDPPISLADWHCADAVNVDFFASTGPRRRNGSTALAMTSATMTGVVSSLARHVPGTDETLAELWAMDDAATPVINRLAGGTSWATPTLKDVPTGNGWDLTAASLNGKLFLNYKSGSARLHCYDPNASGGASVKRVGLAAMGIPSIGNTGSGSYAATPRTYRTRAAIQSGGITTYLSEPTAGVSFTPSGSGTSAVVTQGTLPGEGETHWVIEASIDGATYFVISTVVIGTTTYNDTALVSTYSSNTVSVTVGTYTLPKPYRFIATDQSRLLGFGSYTTTDKQDTLEFTAIVGASNIGDDERIPVGNSITLDENDSGAPTGLIGPVNGSFFAFKYRSFYKLTPTGVAAAPYAPLKISGTIGAVGPKAIFVGEDESGNPAIYFMSSTGPYRYSMNNGLEYLGHNVEDRIVGANNGVSLNLAATKVVSHGLWYRARRQAIFWIATGSNNDPNERLVLGVGHVQSQTEQPIPDGWTRDDGPSARCSVPFANTVGAAMSFDLKPYYGSTTAVTIAKGDTGNQDLGVNYQGYALSKAYLPDGLGGTITLNKVGIHAATSYGVTLTCTVTATSEAGGQSSTSDTCNLTPINGETRGFRTFGGGVSAGAPNTSFQVQIGDGQPQNVAWQVDQTVIGWSVGSAVV